MVEIAMLLSVIFLITFIICINFFPQYIETTTTVDNTHILGTDNICKTEPSTPKANEILEIKQ